MISKRYYCVALCLLSLTLSSCIGDGKNSSESGLVVHFAESHVDLSAAQKPAHSLAMMVNMAAMGGYDNANIEHHAIKDKHGRSLSIYRAYLVIDNIELVPCTSLAQLPQKILGSFIPAAYAHAGHGSEPVGGRALDAPNVIDIVTQEGYLLPLGDMAIAPGHYCGIRVSLVRLANMAYGKPGYAASSTDNPTTEPEIPEMAGFIFSLRADYCEAVDGAGVCTHRVKVDVEDTGLTESVAKTVEFATPLEISAGLREVFVVVGIDYGSWLANVDVTQLASDNTEKQKLLDNIAASIHVYDKGFGELPPNI